MSTHTYQHVHCDTVGGYALKTQRLRHGCCHTPAKWQPFSRPHPHHPHHLRLHAQHQPRSAVQDAVDTTGARQAWHREDIHVVLVHPQIPQNSGNVARTCAATATPLHLVGPLGFDIQDTKLKRAGLDYWPHVCCMVHEDWQAFEEFWKQQPGPKRLVAFSKFGRQHYASPGVYQPGDWLLFGAETTGLPAEAHAASAQGAIVKIPINDTHVRSLNLASSVAIGLYEAIRQLDPPPEGELLPAVEGAPVQPIEV